jgi:hypothetical protein
MAQLLSLFLIAGLSSPPTSGGPVGRWSADTAALLRNTQLAKLPPKERRLTERQTVAAFERIRAHFKPDGVLEISMDSVAYSTSQGPWQQRSPRRINWEMDGRPSQGVIDGNTLVSVSPGGNWMVFTRSGTGPSKPIPIKFEGRWKFDNPLLHAWDAEDRVGFEADVVRHRQVTFRKGRYTIGKGKTAIRGTYSRHTQAGRLTVLGLVDDATKTPTAIILERDGKRLNIVTFFFTLPMKR